MGRSATLSGASVALDLLPKEFSSQQPEAGQIRVLGPAKAVTSAEAALAALSRMQLDSPLGGVALGPIAAFADLTTPFSVPGKAGSDVADMAAGRLAEALGRQLCALIGQDSATSCQIYRIALCLAGLNRSAEAYSVLSLDDSDTAAHPTVLALRGYLSFQVGEAEMGRRALARAALAARGTPSMRGILHFTQHVLLVQQFGG